MKFTKYIATSLIALSGFACTSCSDSFFDVEDTSALGEKETAEAAGKNPDAFLKGMWSWMVSFMGEHDSFGHMSQLHASDMMGQDIVMAGEAHFYFDYQVIFRMENYRRPYVCWNTYYTLIAKANEIINLYPEGPQNEEQKALVGQAYSARGFAYYNLIQWFQAPTNVDGTLNLEAPGVPLMYTAADGKTPEEIANFKGRNTVKEVMDQAEADLKKGAEYLANYQRKNNDKNNIDGAVANGLLARYYLLAQKWQEAANAAKAARANHPIMHVKDYQGFLNLENPELMWGFKHNAETSTFYASFFSNISCLSPGYAGLFAPRLIDKSLYEKMDENDERLAWFNGAEENKNAPTAGASFPYANYKYGASDDFTAPYTYMRGAEMVLIEAEAYAHMGNGAKAAEVLGELMTKRVEGWNKASVDVEDVYLQRRLELWGEGQTVFDLKRLGKGIDRNYEGTNHPEGLRLAIPAGDVSWTYQIPQKELQENPMISEKDQNP